MRSHIIKSATAMVCGITIAVTGTLAVTGPTPPMAVASEECDTTQCRFSDVTDKTPHAEDILWLASTGITTGYEDGTFRGMTPVYRQDMAAFLRRLAVMRGINEADTWKPTTVDWKQFSDVTDKTPHAEDILWLASTGITTGYEDGTFKGMTPVYRQDMAAFLHRFANIDGGAIATKDTPAFSDINQVAHRADVEWLASMGVTTGYDNDDGTSRFEGMTPVYRQDMAAFLHRLDDGLGCVPRYVPAITHTEEHLISAERVVPVLHEAQTETVTVPAVTHEEPVYEQQQVDIYTFEDGHVIEGRTPTSEEEQAHGSYSLSHENRQVQVGTKTVVDVPEHTEIKIIKEAWTEYVTIPAKYGYTEVVDVPAHYTACPVE